MAIPILTVAPREMKGLNQAIDANLLDLSYSPDCQNIDVSEGILTVRRGSEKAVSLYGATPPYPIRGMFEYIRTNEGYPKYIVGTQVSIGQYRWYAWLLNGGDYEWKLITTTAFGSTAAMTGVNPAVATGINYPISGNKSLIILGRSKPFKLAYSFTENPEPPYDTVESIHATEISAAPSGDFMTLHRERIWIGSASANKVHYSNAFNPEDWTTAGQTGEIIIETSDGDTLTGVANLLDDIIIFKRNTMWRVSGDIPSEYSLSQVYAEQGTPYPRSICSDGSLCFFGGNDGIYQYTGNDAVPILTDAIKNLWPAPTETTRNIKCTVNDGILRIWDIGNANGKQIFYDTRKKRIATFKAQTVYDAENMVIGGQNSIVYTDGSLMYRLKQTALKFDTANIEAYWITPETDLGSPNASKTLTDMYFTGWGSTNAGAAGGQVKITVYYNESGTQKNKEKTVTLQTTRKLHNVQWNVTGRLFKFKIENVSGSIFNLSNLQFVFEVDRD